MKEKIHNSEIISIIYFVMRSTYIGIGINSYLYYTENDSYISILIGILLGLVPLILMLKVSDIKKDTNINEKFNLFFGKKIGNIINIIISIFILFFTSFLFYDLTNFITSEYLYKTPSLFIEIMMLIPITYILSKGLKAICRTSIILFIISITFYIISILGLIPSFNVSNLLPFMKTDKCDLLLSSLSYIAYSILPLYILLIIPKDNLKNEQKSNKTIIITSIITGIIILVSLITTIGVLGIELASIYQYPDYQMLRRIQIGSFLQRTESILAIQWFLSLFMMIVLCIYYILKTKETIIPKFGNKTLIMIVNIILIIINENLWPNNTTFISFSIKNMSVILYIFILLPILLLYIKSKKKCR